PKSYSACRSADSRRLPTKASFKLTNFNSPIRNTIALSSGDELASLSPSDRSIVGGTPDPLASDANVKVSHSVFRYPEPRVAIYRNTSIPRWHDHRNTPRASPS